VPIALATSTANSLQRVYGTAWETQEALDEHRGASPRPNSGITADSAPNWTSSLPARDRAGCRFHTQDGADPITDGGMSRSGAPGCRLRARMDPPIRRSTLFETSGHLGWYADSMSHRWNGGATYYLKPMSCPMHILVYKEPGTVVQGAPGQILRAGDRFTASSDPGFLHASPGR